MKKAAVPKTCKPLNVCREKDMVATRAGDFRALRSVMTDDAVVR